MCIHRGDVIIKKIPWDISHVLQKIHSLGLKGLKTDNSETQLASIYRGKV